jgi:hypothetical protein
MSDHHHRHLSYDFSMTAPKWEKDTSRDNRFSGMTQYWEKLMKSIVLDESAVNENGEICGESRGNKVIARVNLRERTIRIIKKDDYKNMCTYFFENLRSIARLKSDAEFIMVHPGIYVRMELDAKELEYLRDIYDTPSSNKKTVVDQFFYMYFRYGHVANNI